MRGVVVWRTRFALAVMRGGKPGTLQDFPEEFRSAGFAAGNRSVRV